MPLCPFCDSRAHFLGGCPEFKKLDTDQIVSWIQEKGRCWKCGRAHKPDECTLQKPCHSCKEVHLTVLHDAAQKATSHVYRIQTSNQEVFMDKPTRPHNIMLKVVQILLHGPAGTLDTYAILDDGSERTMLLQQAADKLQLEGKPETMLLRTIHDDIVECHGQSSSIQLSPKHQPDVKFTISRAFSASNICLSEYNYPLETLQQKYSHLRNLLLPTIKNASPMILIGSDFPELIVPIQPAIFGPRGAPVAINSKLGWTIQGPIKIGSKLPEHNVFKTSSFSPTIVFPDKRPFPSSTICQFKACYLSKAGSTSC